MLYQPAGDMPLGPAANGFSSYAFGGRFHCQDGHFVPVDPADGEPVLRFTFHNHNGKMLVVDLKGEQPVYLGDLPVGSQRADIIFSIRSGSRATARSNKVHLL